MLLLFSAVFYVLWGPAFFLLLAALVAVNYAFGLALAQPGERSGRPGRRGLLALALCVNIAPLIWFKYSGFLAQVFMQVSGWEFSFTPPPLPVGISFSTFIQIAWLVGVYRRQIAPEGALRHALFVSCFPYVMSGPIVRYEQIGPQFDALGMATSRQLGMGVALFVMGMAKKVLLADSLAPYANAVFNAAERGFPLSGAEAWAGSFCYTFQLYFDFSGYTDMALGIGLMLGLNLPENFNVSLENHLIENNVRLQNLQSVAKILKKTNPTQAIEELTLAENIMSKYEKGNLTYQIKRLLNELTTGKQKQ